MRSRVVRECNHRMWSRQCLRPICGKDWQADIPVVTRAAVPADCVSRSTFNNGISIAMSMQKRGRIDRGRRYSASYQASWPFPFSPCALFAFSRWRHERRAGGGLCVCSFSWRASFRIAHGRPPDSAIHKPIRSLSSTTSRRK